MENFGQLSNCFHSDSHINFRRLNEAGTEMMTHDFKDASLGMIRVNLIPLTVPNTQYRPGCVRAPWLNHSSYY